MKSGIFFGKQPCKLLLQFSFMEIFGKKCQEFVIWRDMDVNYKHDCSMEANNRLYFIFYDYGGLLCFCTVTGEESPQWMDVLVEGFTKKGQY